MEPPRRAVAYVLTHHPRVALTFIAAEMMHLQRLGIDVAPISMNACSDADVAMPGGRIERDRTFYIKQAGARRAIVAVGRLAVQRPLGFARLTVRAMRSGGTDLRAIAWRLFHLVEGVLVADHCRAQGIRHVHAHFGQSPASIAWFAAESGNLTEPGRWTWSFTIHGFQDFVNEQDSRLDLKTASASFVVCVSDFTRSQLMRITAPTSWSKYHIVRCGVDLRNFVPRATEPDNEPPCVVIVARISPEKGHVVLLHALSILSGRGVAVSVQMIGGGPFRSELHAEALAAGLDHLIEFVGELEPQEVIERLARADVFCLPSFAEGLPVSIMEAMAVGVPVVSTYIGGIPELAIDGRTALTVPAGNAAALADAIQRMIENPDLRARLAAAARGEIERSYQSAANVTRLAELFTKAAGWDEGR
jgi:colanic acid/amylovoran biosynthesis glycosyltransferase